MKTRVHYPEKIKWKVIDMKKDGYSNRTIVEGMALDKVAEKLNYSTQYIYNKHAAIRGKIEYAVDLK